MKTKFILGFAMLVMLFSNCGVKEREKMQAQADSLNVELKSSRDAVRTLQEVGVLMDSIDMNRAVLRTHMAEGTDRLNYSTRLKNIERYVRETETKIADLEGSLRKSRSFASGQVATIRHLKTDLESANQQLAALQEEVMKSRTENGKLVAQVTQKDSLLIEGARYIKAKENDLVIKETEAREMNEHAQSDKANLYFAQGQALETAANRTKFAPRKKRETRREAVEVYKLALSLGKTEAQDKINRLQ